MADPEMPLISLITLNYNRTADTIAFLESSRHLTYPRYEILVCDMASDSDPTPDIINGNFPHTRIIRSNENLGFAQGNNWGISHAEGSYYFIVNNDTILTPDILDILSDRMFKNEKIAVVSPKIKSFHDPERIEYAGFHTFNMYTGRTSARGFMEIDKGAYDKEEETSGVHGCAMLIRASVLKETGSFPEKFFLYYEEWDLVMRIRQKGYKIRYNGLATIYHKGSSSIGKNNPLQTYYLTRNRILLMRRNAGPFQFLVFTCFFAVLTLPKSLISYFAKGRFTDAKYFLKGIFWNFYSSSRSNV